MKLLKFRHPSPHPPDDELRLAGLVQRAVGGTQGMNWGRGIRRMEHINRQRPFRALVILSLLIGLASSQHDRVRPLP
jgi:hypothetical protein